MPIANAADAPRQTTIAQPMPVARPGALCQRGGGRHAIDDTFIGPLPRRRTDDMRSPAATAFRHVVPAVVVGFLAILLIARAATAAGDLMIVGNFLDQDISILKVDGTTVTDTGKRLALPGHPASMRGRNP